LVLGGWAASFAPPADSDRLDAMVSGEELVYCQSCLSLFPSVCLLTSALWGYRSCPPEVIDVGGTTEVKQLWVFATPLAFVPVGLRPSAIENLKKLRLPLLDDWASVREGGSSSASPAAAQLLRSVLARSAGAKQNPRTRVEHMGNLAKAMELEVDLTGVVGSAVKPTAGEGPASLIEEARSQAENMVLRQRLATLERQASAPPPVPDGGEAGQMLKALMGQMEKLSMEVSALKGIGPPGRAAVLPPTVHAAVLPRVGTDPLVSVPPRALRADDLDTDEDGFKGSNPGHALGVQCELYEDYCANLGVRSRTAADREAYGSRLERITGLHRLDVPPGEDLVFFTPLGGLQQDGGTEIDLGEGLHLSNRVKTAQCPERMHWVDYCESRVADLWSHVSNPSGERRLDGEWGPHRMWQGRYRIGVYQLLHELVVCATVGTIDRPLSWMETWMLICNVVGRHFYRKPLVVYGSIRGLLEAVRSSSVDNLRTPSSGRAEIKAVAMEMMTSVLMDTARVLAAEVVSRSPAPTGGAPGGPAAAKAAKVAAGPARAAGAGAKGPTCATPNCSYVSTSSPPWQCKHDFVTVCHDNVKGSVCGLAHARAGPRAFACLAGRAAASVLTPAELVRAFGLGEGRWKASNPPKLAEFQAALALLK